MMRRLATLLAWAMLCVANTGSATPEQPAVQAPLKILRYAFPIAETGFDPAQIRDHF